MLVEVVLVDIERERKREDTKCFRFLLFPYDPPQTLPATKYHRQNFVPIHPPSLTHSWNILFHR